MIARSGKFPITKPSKLDRLTVAESGYRSDVLGAKAQFSEWGIDSRGRAAIRLSSLSVFVDDEGRFQFQINNDHGFIEMVSDLRNATLSCAFIGLYNEVCGAEIIGNSRIGDELIIHYHLFFEAHPGYQIIIGFWVGIKLACNK